MNPARRESAVPQAQVTPTQAQIIRRRLMERVADADGSHRTLGAAQGEWRAFAPGVRIKILREHEGVVSYLLRLGPGARLPPHRHRLDEECIVIEGQLLVGSRTQIGPGGYHLAHAGALHATISTETGATVFLRGAAPHPEQILS